MLELHNVDPRSLTFDPHNPRRASASPAADEQLLASVKAIGIVQPPIVMADGDGFMVKIGQRRVRAAIMAELPTIDVLVATADEAADAMRAVSENVVRAAMTSVDTWRAIDRLEALGWNEPAIATALALPSRKVRCLKLLAHLHPPMLEVMAHGSMPDDDQLRTIAAAALEEQTQVWKKHKPSKKRPDVAWWDIARALERRRIAFSIAQFNEDLARAYGVAWEEDLFAPADEDGRYTTNAEGFIGAQTEHMRDHRPEGSVILTVDKWGQPELPKKAQQVWSKAGKGDVTGYYINTRTCEIATIVYRMPKAQAGKNKGADGGADAKTRPEVTKKGHTMIGDLRTDALHQALAQGPIKDDTLLGLLVLAFACNNVSVDSGDGSTGADLRTIARGLLKGTVLDTDTDTIRQSARNMLIAVLSCRENRTQSGVLARVAGETIGAAAHLPNMATDAFLSCLSRPALEALATGEALNLAPRVKHTRERVVQHFETGRYLHPEALFAVPEDELNAKRRYDADDDDASDHPDADEDVTSHQDELEDA